MKIKNYSTYKFKQYNVVGVKAKINFAKTKYRDQLVNPIKEIIQSGKFNWFMTLLLKI